MPPASATPCVPAGKASMSACSTRLPLNDSRVRRCSGRARSRRQPRAAAMPRPRRIHSPAPSKPFIASNTRPPTSARRARATRRHRVRRRTGAARSGRSGPERGAGQDQAGVSAQAQGARRRPIARPAGLRHRGSSFVAGLAARPGASATNGRANASAARGRGASSRTGRVPPTRTIRPADAELHGPAAADRRERRDRGERERHAEEQRQGVPVNGSSLRANAKGDTGEIQGSDREHATRNARNAENIGFRRWGGSASQ